MAIPELSPDQKPPSFDFVFNATPEQQKVLQEFLDFATTLEPDEIDPQIVRGMELYDRDPELVSQVATYLENNPGGFAVLSLYGAIDKTRASLATIFDPITESVIDNDPENNRILQKLQKTPSDWNRLALRRNRFRILSKRASDAA